MKNIWKSAALATLSVVTFAAVAATAYTVKDVNDTIAELLKPFNNDVTTASITFTNLDVGQDRVNKFGVTGALNKIGQTNKLEVNLPRFEYVNDGNGKPNMALAANMKFDLVKAFSQKFINEMAPDLADIATDLAKNFTEEFGDAVTIDTAVDELLKDEAGDVVSTKVHFNAKLDLSKLPANVPIQDALFETFEFNLNLSRTEGGFSARVDLNPKYKGFAADQTGFKELIEALLNKDAKTYENIIDMAEWVDDMADWLVNKKPDQN